MNNFKHASVIPTSLNLRSRSSDHGDQSYIHPVYRNSPSSTNSTDPLCYIDREIAEYGGTTSAIDRLPESIESTKNEQARVLDHLRTIGELSSELDLYRSESIDLFDTMDSIKGIVEAALEESKRKIRLCVVILDKLERQRERHDMRMQEHRRGLRMKGHRDGEAHAQELLQEVIF